MGEFARIAFCFSRLKSRLAILKMQLPSDESADLVEGFFRGLLLFVFLLLSIFLALLSELL
ncbi:MAG: hypothetical protein ACJAY7_001061 [Pseudohongiellaceae bacterium]|jgi:hypothetical protein